MEFYYFPAHGRGLLPRMLIAHLDLGQDKIKDVTVALPEFVANKAKHGGRFGQLPALKLADGTIMGQTNALCRFLAKSYKGKDGTNFYPGPSDPMATYWIDQFVD